MGLFKRDPYIYAYGIRMRKSKYDKHRARMKSIEAQTEKAAKDLVEYYNRRSEHYFITHNINIKPRRRRRYDEEPIPYILVEDDV